MLDRLTVDSFKPAVGGTFTAEDRSGTRVSLELVDAGTHDPDASAEDESGKRSPFTLLFRGPAEPILAQRIYRLEHESLAALEIFIVPLGVDAEGTRYEAIFA